MSLLNVDLLKRFHTLVRTLFAKHRQRRHLLADTCEVQSGHQEDFHLVLIHLMSDVDCPLGLEVL